MKSYIVIFWTILLLSACAGGGENIYTEKAQRQSVDTTQLERFDKHIGQDKPAVDENNEMEKDITAQDFDIIAQQKTQQFFDMISAANNPDSPKDYQSYMDKYARKLWVNPENSEKVWQTKLLKNADSIRIVHSKLLNFEEKSPSESIGAYQLKLESYQNGKSQLSTAQAKVYFEIIDLAIDGKIYKTIKAKLLDLQF